ncbi:hypothetical protein V5740_09380 [Croceibacterium sp. TMG7-5b_MA50]|uniref:hypothetical protein n=1 Tax=Croceibacterium sp. TMG7-5b_MA50 TaxID=3121290 RepID=UPI003221C0E6
MAAALPNRWRRLIMRFSPVSGDLFGGSPFSNGSFVPQGRSFGCMRYPIRKALCNHGLAKEQKTPAPFGAARKCWTGRTARRNYANAIFSAA